MKTKMQLSPKVAPNIKLSARMIYVVGGIIIAILIGIFLFIYLNLGNPFRSLAADITFTSNGSGNWATNATWQGGASPGGTLNSNDVTIKSNHTVTRTGDVTGSTNVVISIEANASLTINGDLIVDNDFILNNSGTLIVTGSLMLKNNAALTVNGGGTMTVSNNVIAENNTNFIVNGQLNVGGDVTFGNNEVFGGTGSVRIAGNGCGDWAGSTPCQNGSTILPVKLLAFKASDHEDGTVKITWSTAQEKNNDYFTIQRSGDGLTYTDLGTVKGNGTTENVSHYDMVDNDPGAERLYYRLAQTDFDGATEIFAPVFVQVKLKPGQLSAYPNPMTGRNLTVHLPKIEAGTIQFLDNGGKIILHKESDGSSNLIELDFADDLLQGLYYIKYKSRSGAVQSLKIVKK
jgi:hypothetical protein